MHKALRQIWVIVILLLIISCRSTAPAGLAPAPTSGASSIQVFVEPEAGNPPILTILNSAQKSIRMTMYLLSDRDVIDALKGARGRGVDVRVLVEAQPFGGGAGNRPAMSDLQAANVSVKTGNPAYRLTHQKSIIVDDQVAVIMTFNQTRSALAANREYGIIDRLPVDVAEIAAVFEADWNRKAPTLANANLLWSPVNARQRLLALIDSATKALDIESEEMQDDEIEKHLVDAVARGVEVRVVMSPTPSGADANVPGQDRVTRGGVKLRLVKTPYIHAKMIIADGVRAFVGSQNLSTASLDSNRELGISVTDSKVIQTLSATFAGDWNIGK